MNKSEKFFQREMNHRKPKVLLVSPAKNIGGMSTYANQILKSEILCDFLLFAIDRPLKKRLNTKAVGYSELFNAGSLRALVGALIALFQLIVFPFLVIYKRIDVVLISGVEYWSFWQETIMMVIAKLLRRKIILHYLGAFDIYYQESTPKVRKLIEWSLNIPDRTLTLSKKHTEIMKNFIPDYKLGYIPTSVDVEGIELSNVTKPISANRKVIFLGGSSAFRKGILNAVDIVKMVVKVNEEIEFYFAGNENVKNIIEPLVEEVGPMVRYIGWLTQFELNELFRSSGIMILPTQNDGLPYAIIEAMRDGLVILATPVGAIPEVVNNGENGFIIPYGDNKAFADKILLLAKDHEMFTQMSLLNREKILRDFSLKNAHTHLEAIIYEVANSQ